MEDIWTIKSETFDHQTPQDHKNLNKKKLVQEDHDIKNMDKNSLLVQLVRLFS